MTPVTVTSHEGKAGVAAKLGDGRPSVAAFFRLASGADVFLILLGFGVVASLVSPDFLTVENVSNLLTQSALLGILSIAQFLVILIGGFDLSVAAVMALASVLLARHADWGLPAAASVAGLAGLACGVGNGLSVTYGRVQPLIATLAMMGIARGLAFTVTERSILVKNPILDQLNAWSGVLSMPVLIWLGLVLIAAWWCLATRPGRHAYAVGGNEATARLAGVPASSIKLGIYAASGLLSGIAGVVLVIRSQSGVPNVGNGWELDSIASVVIGGTSLFGGEGNLPKAMAGVLIYQMVANVMNLVGVDPFYQSIVRAFVIILAVGISVLRQTHGARRQVHGRL